MEAGFHEVVVCPATLNTIEERRANGKSLWRVSSTLFSHFQSDTILEPFAPYNTADACEKYPPIMTGAQVLSNF